MLGIVAHQTLVSAQCFSPSALMASSTRFSFSSWLTSSESRTFAENMKFSRTVRVPVTTSSWKEITHLDERVGYIAIRIERRHIVLDLLRNGCFLNEWDIAPSTCIHDHPPLRTERRFVFRNECFSLFTLTTLVSVSINQIPVRELQSN